MSHLEYWEDQSGTAGLENLPQDKDSWKSNHGAPPNFGFTRSAFWFRFELPEDIVAKDALVLLFHYALTDDIKLFMPKLDSGYTVLKTGRNYPVSNRRFRTQDLALEIPLANQVTHRIYYIRMQTQGSAQFPMDLISFHEYFNQAYSSSLAYRIFMGSMLIMIAYNLIFFLVTRVLSYLVYVVFISTSTLFVLSVYGISYLYLWPESPAFNKISIPFFLGLCNAMISIFNLISLRQVLRGRLTRNLLYGHTLLGFLITGSSFLVPYTICVRLATLQTMFIALMLPIIYLGLCRQKYRPAYFFLLSIGSLALGALIFGLKTFGFLPPNMVTESSAMLASTAQITLLTFALADQYREIQKQNEHMHERLISMQRENIRSLDQKVEEKTRDVRMILRSIQQGIFTISGVPPRIDEEYSQHLESLFPGQTIAGNDPLQFLGNSSQLSGDEREQLKSALVFCLDSPLFNFELNEEIFPKQIILNDEEGKRSILQLEWSPVQRLDENIGKILVAIRDVTRLIELEEQKNRMDADFRLTNLVLSKNKIRLQNFLLFNRQLLERLRLHIGDENPDHLKSLLHTLKGNSRTFGLPNVANLCHQLEDLYKLQRVPLDQVQTFMNAIEQGFHDLHAIAEKIHDTGAHGHEMMMSQVLKSFDQLRSALAGPGGQGPAFVRRAAENLAGLVFRDLEETVKSLLPSLEITAKELDKAVPQLAYEQSSAIYVDHAIAEILQSSLVHLFSNALIHGIESAAERVRLKKPMHGQIFVRLAIAEDSIHMRISDDGRGFSFDAVRQRALQSGIISADETNTDRIVETIFSAGISTAAEVSLHAGRGMGMTAVRSMLKDIGATIQIVLDEEAKSPNVCSPFHFFIQLPRARDSLLVRINHEGTNAWERVS